MDQADLRQLFWDVGEQQLGDLSQEVVVARVLSHGTLDQVRSMWRVYPLTTIRAVFALLKPQALSARRRAYFELLLS